MRTSKVAPEPTLFHDRLSVIRAVITKTCQTMAHRNEVESDAVPVTSTEICSNRHYATMPTQTGNTFNIVNSTKVHVGNSYILQLDKIDHVQDMMPVEKTETIDAVMTAKCDISIEYRHIVSRHLGRNWRCLFRKLGFDDGYLDTCYESQIIRGLPEVIYCLLTDWVNAGDRTLGELCTVLWSEQKHTLVKMLSEVYESSCKAFS